MERIHFRFDSGLPAWRALWQKVAPCCEHEEKRPFLILRRLSGRKRGVRIQGSWCCLNQCLERVLGEAFRDVSVRPSAPSHRIPLGLLLLSRQQLTVAQLREALEAQREAGYGRIGEWVQRLGFAGEPEITAALARQWACPVFQARTKDGIDPRAPEIPAAVLRRSQMIPVGYVEATGTLHLAFAESVDYRVLYAVERIVGCRTEPCLTNPSFLRSRLEMLAARGQDREVVFDHRCDRAESAQIIRSYADCAAASEIRLAAYGSYLWARLLRPPLRHLDLLLSRVVEPSTTVFPLTPVSATASVS